MVEHKKSIVPEATITLLSSQPGKEARAICDDINSRFPKSVTADKAQNRMDELGWGQKGIIQNYIPAIVTGELRAQVIRGQSRIEQIVSTPIFSPLPDEKTYTTQGNALIDSLPVEIWLRPNG
jgi:hypothetical protein